MYFMRIACSHAFIEYNFETTYIFETQLLSWPNPTQSALWGQVYLSWFSVLFQSHHSIGCNI